MLEQSWETYATQLANANDGETLAQVIDQIVSAHSIDLEAPANVIYAHDTRYDWVKHLFETSNKLTLDWI